VDRRRPLTPAEFEAYCARRDLAGEAVPGGYLVEKSRPHKRADVAVRIAATPIALAIDAASGAALAGAVLFTCCPELWLELAAEPQTAAIDRSNFVRIRLPH
jgi:hypothetical protein